MRTMQAHHHKVTRAAPKAIHIKKGFGSVHTSKLQKALKRIEVAASSNVGQVVAIRSIDAIVEFLLSADSNLLKEVAAAPNNYEVLLEQLSAPMFIKTVDLADPLVRARLRGLKAKRELVDANGGALNVDKVASLLGISRQAVDLRRKNRQLIGLDLGKRGYAYPVWQFEEKILAAIPNVLEKIGAAVGQWEILSFFLNKNSYLNGKRPIEELRAGRVDDVLRVAEVYMTQGEP